MGFKRFAEPEFAKEFGGVHGLLEVDFLDEKGVCTEVVGAVDVAQLVGGGEDDDGKVAEAFLLANPGEDCKTVYSGEFEVEEDQDREGIFGAVAEFSGASEVLDGFFAVAHELNGVGEESFLEGALHEEDVVLPVFND